MKIRARQHILKRFDEILKTHKLLSVEIKDDKTELCFEKSVSLMVNETEYNALKARIVKLVAEG